LMALFDRCDEFALANGLDIQPFVAYAFAVLVFWRLTVVQEEVGDDVFVTFKSAKFPIVAVEETPGATGNHSTPM